MRHLSFSGEEILETIRMVRTEQLDIRTITVGISLLDCVSDDADALCNNVLGKITHIAKDLRKVSGELAGEFGIPIVNNRIAVTPISLIAGKSGRDGLLMLATTLDRAARELQVDFIGGVVPPVGGGGAPGRPELSARATQPAV